MVGARPFLFSHREPMWAPGATMLGALSGSSRRFRTLHRVPIFRSPYKTNDPKFGARLGFRATRAPGRPEQLLEWAAKPPGVPHRVGAKSFVPGRP